MKWKSVSEIRLFRWLAVVMLLVIAVPIGWQIAANERAADKEALADQTRILAAISDGRLDQAWQWSRVYIKNEHADAEALRAVGTAFLDAGRPVEAFILLDASAFREPAGTTLALLARACLADGRTFEAVSYADRAISLGVGGKSGQALLGACLAADGRYADAVTAFSRVLEKDPFDRGALRGKAAAFQAIERYGQALIVWNVLIERLESDATAESLASLREASVQRAICLDGLDRTDEALQAWTELLSVATADGDDEIRVQALLGLARHALKSGNAAGAACRFQEAASASTGSVRMESRLQLALCLSTLGRIDEARNEVASLVAQSPEAVSTIFGDDEYEALRPFFF